MPPGRRSMFRRSRHVAPPPPNPMICDFLRQQINQATLFIPKRGDDAKESTSMGAIGVSI